MNQFPPPSKIFSANELRDRLRGMITPMGLQASGNDLFRGAVFGRDSLWSARFLVDDPNNKDIVRLALHSLAKTQGTVYAPERAEEPGKIAHECRRKDDKGNNPDILAYFDSVYGEAAPGLYLIYTTVDATPLWVILLGEYCERYGRDILSERVTHLSGEEMTMFDVLVRAAQWIEQHIRHSDLGLLEVAREDREGHTEFHVLRDGRTSYRHEDGTYPNLKQPIAYLEVQGYAFDALRTSAALTRHTMPRKAFEWRNLAKRLQARTLEHFWQSGRGVFAAAIDRDPITHAYRPLCTLTTVQPEILGTGIFDGLSPHERKGYVEGTLKNFFTPEFQTAAGPRAVSLAHDHMMPYWAYQWSRTTWPVLSHLVARGLRRQGFHALARDMSVRLLNTVHTAGQPRELFYITPEGRVAYDPECLYGEGEEEIAATNLGEADQTWTICAVMEARSMLKVATPQRFERDVMQGQSAELRTLPELREEFTHRARIKINRAKAQVLESSLISELLTKNMKTS